MKCGADPDLGDDFSNVNLKAREKGLHWWSGKTYLKTEFSHFSFSILFSV